MYKKVADAQYRSKLSNELMMYHMKVSRDKIYIMVNTKLILILILAYTHSNLTKTGQR